MGIKGRLRNLEQAAEQNLLTFRLRYGTTASFHQDAVMECLLYESERGRAHFDGEPVPPAHPLVEALRNAEDLVELTKRQGTILALWVGEDEIIRGERERPGPSVK